MRSGRLSSLKHMQVVLGQEGEGDSDKNRKEILWLSSSRPGQCSPHFSLQQGKGLLGWEMWPFYLVPQCFVPCLEHEMIPLNI